VNSTPLPAQAQVIVIGGGIAGCSTAYHLAKQGVGDVVVIEKGQLTSGSTWHAAGLVGQLRASANITRLLQYSVDLYQSLEALTGLSTGWKSTGSIRLCCTKDRRIEIERQVATARSYGIDAEFLSPGQIAELCPAMSTTGIDSGVYISSDGNVNPSDLTQALARGARQLGVKFIEHTTVLGITLNNHGVSGIETSSGSIDCEQVAICAGLWSREIAHLAGANIPLIPSFHQYMVTEPIEGIVPGMPGIRDPDRLTYFKEEVGGLAAGGYELNPVPYDGKPSADDPDFRLFPEMTDHFAQFMPGMVERFPQLESVGIKRWFRGLESFTEDTHFILGELPEVRGLFCACGFNAMGIAAGGGAGGAPRNAAMLSMRGRQKAKLPLLQEPLLASFWDARGLASSSRADFRRRHQRARGLPPRPPLGVKYSACHLAEAGDSLTTPCSVPGTGTAATTSS
jgi:4-methylaminobutanoate oxidase (formaldehyde-forming)